MISAGTSATPGIRIDVLPSPSSNKWPQVMKKLAPSSCATATSHSFPTFLGCERGLAALQAEIVEAWAEYYGEQADAAGSPTGAVIRSLGGVE